MAVSIMWRAGKSPTANLPFASNAGMPETNIGLPTLTALETGIPRTGLPIYSSGSALPWFVQNSTSDKSDNALIQRVMVDPYSRALLSVSRGQEAEKRPAQ
jgi:hypothetical protein